MPFKKPILLISKNLSEKQPSNIKNKITYNKTKINLFIKDSKLVSKNRKNKKKID